MKQSIKTTFELFIRNADELTQEEFTNFLETFGHELSIQYKFDPQKLIVGTIAPSKTMHKSFILTYRMFVQEREQIGLIHPTNSIPKALSDSSLSLQWLEQVQDVSQKVKTFLCEKPNGQMVFNLIDQHGNLQTEDLTRWDILETLLYGEYAHASQRERLKNWLSTPFEPMVREFLMMEFRDILAFTLGGIQHLAYYARIELSSL